jgi:sec-independent protein translocase protein TatA
LGSAQSYNPLEMPIHWFWIAALLLVVLIVFGPGRLPELGAGVGKAMREFRKATSELTNEVKATVEAKPETPAPSAPPAASTTTSSDTSKTTS